MPGTRLRPGIPAFEAERSRRAGVRLLRHRHFGLVLAGLCAALMLQPEAAAAYVKRINCGTTSPDSLFVDSRGYTFIPDEAYTAQNEAGYVGGFPQGPPAIWKPVGGTPDPGLYLSTRANWSEYRFDVPNGTYIVRLRFADLFSHGPNQRILALSIEGQSVLPSLDIYAKVRDYYAIDYTFPVTVSDGQLNVTASIVLRLTQLNAIEVWDAMPDTEAPAAPAGIVISPCYGRVLIDWASNAEEDLAGYHVDRADTPTGPWQRLTTSLARSSRFEDATALPTFPYYYRVVAVDVWGNESTPSTVLPGMVKADAETDLPIYQITIAPGVWQQLNLAIQEDIYYPADFTYNEVTWYNVGVRYRGRTSRSVSKKSWKIKFNEFVPGQEFISGQKELNLDSTFGERTIMREKLASDFCELVDVPDFDTRHVQLRVNGEFFGVYSAPENVDKRWIEKHSFDPSGSLYKAEVNACFQLLPDTLAYMQAYSKKTNEATGYADLIQFIELVNATPPTEIFNVLAPIFDIESFLNYNAAMIALSNDSFGCHNYFLFHDIVTDKWTYLPDDLDSTFGHVEIFDQQVIPYLTMLRGEENILIDKLHDSPHFRRRLFERVLEMMDEDMTSARIDPVIDSTFALMHEDARIDWRKWGWEDPAWIDGAADEIKSYIPGRQSYVQSLAPGYMPAQTLFLNEIMADNDGTIADEMGDFDDWIEIVNLGTAPVSLAGCYLTDDIAFPTRWAVPDTTIPAGGYILFWCDGEPLEGPTHTNFRLEKTGEWVGLFGRLADGLPPLDSKGFGRQIKDVAFGRYPDGGYNWTLMGTPTPWGPNLPQGNLPPVITQVDHFPATPPLNVTVRVTARIEDDSGVTAAKVFYRPDGVFIEEPMVDDGTNGDLVAGDHIYTAQLPGQQAPVIVHYYIWAEDTAGRTYTDPRDAPIETHAYTVDYSPPDLFVNEFLALNVTGITDEFGEHDDWIEVYNGGQDPVSLFGLRLSDNLAVPDKYIFPDTTLAPGEFILVWCDNDPLQGPFHADFRLSASGEQVGLFASNMAGFAVIDSVSFGPQNADISYGRYPDGGSLWRFYLQPTPLASNTSGSGVEPEPGIGAPAALWLGPGRPNPTSGRTSIPFGLPARGHVTLVVYNASGRAVAGLVDEELAPGYYTVDWDGRLGGGRSGGAGTQAPAGVYFYRLSLGSDIRTGKIALLH